MDLSLTAEQEEFRRVIAGFVARDISPIALQYEHSGQYPQEVVETMKSMGLFGLTVPEEFGGLGADSVTLALAFEEISRGWMGVAGMLGTHTVVGALLARFGTQAQKSKWLMPMATGEVRAALALTEPQAGSDLQGIATKADIAGGSIVINGAKSWITNARRAHLIATLVKTDRDADPPHRGMSIVIIENGTAGFEVSRDLGKLGYKGPETCELVITNCEVPESNLIGGVQGRGMQQALSALQVGRINVAARAVGISQSAFDKALAYSSQRRAFGETIDSFQAVQEKLADMATAIQASRLMTWWAASQYDLSGRADVETGMAKLFASETALKCSLDAMRIHGAYGYSTEFDIERLYRDAPLLAIGEGTNDILRLLIAKRLIEEAKFQ